MSVLTLGTETYGKIYQKAVSYCNHRVCDLNHCSTFIWKTPEQIRQIISDWADLNWESYYKRYHLRIPKKALPSAEIDFTLKGEKTISTHQFLKWMHCIRYNIELDTLNRDLNEHETDSYKALETAIEEVTSAILDSIPEYNEAKWAD